MKNREPRAAEPTSTPDSHRSKNWRRTRYIVSDEHRFVYLATHKVASTSILNALLPLFDFDLDAKSSENLKAGIPVKGLHERFSQSSYRISKAKLLAGMDRKYRRYFKFAFVRNPWDRLVSCYMSKVVLEGPGMVLGKYENATLHRNMTFAEFAEAVCLISEEEANPHFRSQHTFLCADGPGKGILADFVGRFENLEKDFACVTRRIGVGVRLPHAASTGGVRNSRSYCDFYDERLARMVGERYREDAEIFGYTF